jgi:2-polyprenyl-3-methyl-5-hydroxy-6-metoxy-1,4-benzoquinol methylase
MRANFEIDMTARTDMNHGYQFTAVCHPSPCHGSNDKGVILDRRKLEEPEVHCLSATVVAFDPFTPLPSVWISFKPIGQMNMTAAFWDSRATRYDNTIREHDELFRLTIERIRDLTSMTDHVLDVGCATGEFSLGLADHVRLLHGIDTSPGMIERASAKAQQLNISSASFSCSDIERLGPEAPLFSVALALNVIHLLDDPRADLKRLRENLAPKGLLISTTPCLQERAWPVRWMVRFAQVLGKAPNIHSLDFEGLTVMIENAGFDIVENALWDPVGAVQWIVARKRADVPGAEKQS